MKRLVIAVVFLGLIWACSSDNGGDITPPTSGTPDPEPPTEVSFDRGPMLSNWADNIIIPSYDAFSGDMVKLTSAFDAFKTDTSTSNLVALREAWLSAYTSWQKVSMFEVGPAESIDFRFNMNIYPTDADKIEGHIQSGVYDLALPSNRSAKGFPALDYLINGLGEDDEAIVSKYTAVDKDGLISYTEALLADMNVLTDEVVAGWSGSYRDTFVSNDGSSSTASVDRFVNDYIFYYEKFLRAGKMGIPLGVFSGNQLPENVESFYSPDVANVLFLSGLQAVQDFFNGKHFNSDTTGESLASYLDNLNTVKDGEDLKAVINNQLNKAREMVATLDSFRTEIENNNPATDMLLAYDEVQRIVPLLKVDMVSAMSISIDFVDADGD